MSLPTDRVSELVRDVAERVVRPRWRSLAGSEIAEKAPGDLVTVADRESEELLTAALRREDPGVLVVGEEATAADPRLLSALAGADHAYVVDPVDGTRNFVHGSPDYAVMVGEVRDGVPVRGWIWQPEHDRLFVAERGAGAFCDGERVRREPPVVGQLRGATSNRRLRGTRPAGLGAPIGPTRFCCGMDYPDLATGAVDFLVYRAVKPWDHVPGSLLVTESGGVARRLDGADYRAGGVVDDPALLVAASGAAWDVARAGIEP